MTTSICEEIETFDDESDPDEVILSVGEKSLVCLYDGEKREGLESLRYRYF